MPAKIDTSDLHHTLQELRERTDEGTPKKSSHQILIHEIIEGSAALERNGLGLGLSGLSAGLDIGFSVLLMAVVMTIGEGIFSDPVIKLLAANGYAVGFILVVIGRSELFTEQTTLAMLPVIGGRAGVGQLARLWGIVLAANLVGAFIFALLVVLIGPSLGVAKESVLSEIGHKMVRHSWIVMFGSAVLAGWLMGLLSWLNAAARSTMSQIVLVWMIAFVIGFAELHHAIVGSVEVLAGALAGDRVSWSDFGRFLLVTVIGNAVGGSVFVALIKYGHAMNAEED